MQAGRYAAGYPAEIKTSNVQRWWREGGVRRGLHGGVAAFYVGLLLDVISKIGAVPNTG